MRAKRVSWLATRTERHTETTAFFRDVLGLSVIREEPGFTILAFPGNADFVEVFDTNHPKAAVYETGPSAGFLVDDIAAARAELDAAGVELLTEIGTGAGFSWFHFRAPDGNVYGVMAS